MHVYTLTFFPSGHFYIGSTKDLDKRIDRHFYDLSTNSHHNLNMQKLVNDNLVEYVSISNIPCQDRETAYKLEDTLIKNFSNHPLCLNIGLSSRGGDNLTNNPNRRDIINRITNAVIDRYSNMSKEEKIMKHASPGKRNPMYGKTHSKEARLKISRKLTGKPNPNKGKPMSESHYKKFMEYIKRRDYHGSKNPFYGKKHSIELIEKISRKMKTKVNHPDYINPNSKRVSINGKVYKTAVIAAIEEGINYSTLAYRCRNKTNPEFKDWFYI